MEYAAIAAVVISFCIVWLIVLLLPASFLPFAEFFVGVTNIAILWLYLVSRKVKKETQKDIIIFAFTALYFLFLARMFWVSAMTVMALIAFVSGIVTLAGIAFILFISLRNNDTEVIPPRERKRELPSKQ